MPFLEKGTLAEAYGEKENKLEELRLLVLKEKLKEGTNVTSVPYFSIIKRSRPTHLRHGVLTPSFCLILQGSKKIGIGQDVIYYNSGDYLTSLIDMPASGQTVYATREVPYVGLRIDLTTQEIADVLTEAGVDIARKRESGTHAAFVGKSDAPLLDSFIRLVKLTEQNKSIPFLADLIRKEMIFYLVNGPYSHLFLQQIFFQQQDDGIGKAIAWIKNHYANPFTIAELAKISNMSVSALHHRFKAVTTLGPLQYQKNLRLQEARQLMLSEAMDATTAARMVGYESPTQFNREYRRMFGLPPMKDIKAIKEQQFPASIDNI